MTLDLEMDDLRYGSELVKRGFAQMQKGGVIMDVTDREEAVIAEEAGAVSVMALERVPADIREAGGVARMADPAKIKEIIEAIDIPVMAKCRIGHQAEAQVLESLSVDMIDESEVLTPADPFYHVDKANFDIPFVCGCRDLGEALRRIEEGAAMIRTKGEAGTGNIVEAVRHQRAVMGEIRELKEKDRHELSDVAKEHGVTVDLLEEVAERQRLPVVNFAAGGIATPSDAALMMQLGSDGVFVGSGIFKSENPERMGRAIVEAVHNYDDPQKVAEISEGLGGAMHGQDVEELSESERLQDREAGR
ncbi:MAG: pyridoxal 5'-phosphate synthase lyase subunit PdxS [Candidatus Thermoplasmatota archaeon]